MDGTRGRFGGIAGGQRRAGQGERGKGRGVGHTTAETGTCRWMAPEVGLGAAGDCMKGNVQINGTRGRFGGQRWVWGLGQGGKGRRERGDGSVVEGQMLFEGFVMGRGVDGGGATAAGPDHGGGCCCNRG